MNIHRIQYPNDDPIFRTQQLRESSFNNKAEENEDVPRPIAFPPRKEEMASSRTRDQRDNS